MRANGSTKKTSVSKQNHMCCACFVVSVIGITKLGVGVNPLSPRYRFFPAAHKNTTLRALWSLKSDAVKQTVL